MSLPSTARQIIHHRTGQWPAARAAVGDTHPRTKQNHANQVGGKEPGDAGKGSVHEARKHLGLIFVNADPCSRRLRTSCRVTNEEIFMRWLGIVI